MFIFIAEEKEKLQYMCRWTICFLAIWSPGYKLFPLSDSRLI